MSEGSKAIDEGQDAVKTNHENLDAEKAAVINQRLLKESQEYKEKYKRALAEKDELETKKLQESGDIAAQLEAEKRKSAAAMQELGKTKKKVISQVVKDKLTKYAGDVHNIDDLLSRPKLKDFLKDGLDEDNLDFNDEVAKSYIEEVKKEAPYIWKAQGPLGVNTSRPGSTGTTSTVDTSKMNAAELKAYIASTFK
jgi:hypothetical protein